MTNVIPQLSLEASGSSRRLFLRDVTTGTSSVLGAFGSTGVFATDVTNYPATDQFGRTRPMIQIISDHGYDATADIQTARALPGYTDDVAALNAALVKNRAVCFRPEVGQVAVNSGSILLQQPNQRLEALGGSQAAPIVRGLGNTQSTLVAGKPDGSAPAAGVVLESLWFVHAGRLGYTGGSLSGLLTGNQSHIEIWQGQAARVINCGGYGAVHWLSAFACGGILIDNPFCFGGVYNPLVTGAQEGKSHIRFASSTLGHTVNAIVRSPQLYGANDIGQQSRVIGAKTVTAQMQVGPQFGISVESVECLNVEGGFVGEYATNAINIQAANTYDILMRVILANVFIDQSNNAQIATARSGSAYPLLDGLDIHGCGINGQQLGTWGLYCDVSAALPSVRRLNVSASRFRALLGAGAFLNGVDNGKVTGTDFSGYNGSNNANQIYGSGIYVPANGQDIHVRDCQFGGGANAFTDANNCLYGLYAESGATVDYGDIRARNMGGTGAALTGGTLTHAAF